MQQAKSIVYFSKLLKNQGLLPGSSGNISIRNKDKIFITPSGISKDELKISDISEIDLEGNQLNKVPPSSEYKMHIEIYKKRSDINAIIHAHPLFVIICMQAKIKPKYKTLEFKKTIKNIAYVNYIEPGSLKLAKEVAKASLKSNLILLKSHGIVCLGKTLSEARIIAEDCENLFKINYCLCLYNKIKPLSEAKEYTI